ILTRSRRRSFDSQRCAHRAGSLICFGGGSRSRLHLVRYPAAKRIRCFLRLFDACYLFEPVEHYRRVGVHMLPDKSRRLTRRANEAATPTQDANRWINGKISHADALRFLLRVCTALIRALPRRRFSWPALPAAMLTIALANVAGLRGRPILR